jgi:hypothetical protein
MTTKIHFKTIVFIVFILFFPSAFAFTKYVLHFNESNLLAPIHINLLENQAKELLKNGKITLTAEDGEVFTFKYISYDDEGLFSIIVENNEGRWVGLIDSDGNECYRGFKSKSCR